MKKISPVKVLENQIKEDEFLIEDIDFEIKNLKENLKEKNKVIKARINSLERKKWLLFDEKRDLKIAKEILEGENKFI